MTQEEKAKAYDKALERARKHNKEYRQVVGKNILEYIFPELAESDDERIRKELIEYVKSASGGFLDTAIQCKTFGKWAAWLEKQGEQKSIDKAEPKFKVGDWVVQENIGVYKIIEICESWYEVIDVKYNLYSIAFDKEYMCHLWSIQDAKDGDILAESKGDVILMFRGIGNTEWNDVIDYYCYYDCYRKNFILQDDVDHWGDINNNQLKPATKEQRELLFKTMEEEGYEWDDEKKELKKVEDENYDGEDYGIDSLFHAQRILEKTLGKVDGYQTDDGILEHKCAIESVNKLYKQKPTWSEEDKEMIDKIIDYIMPMPIFFESTKGKSGKEYTKKFVKDATKWLKSLKQRYTWKPSDEQIKALEEICDEHWELDGLDPLYTLWEQLKKLKGE